MERQRRLTTLGFVGLALACAALACNAGAAGSQPTETPTLTPTTEEVADDTADTATPEADSGDAAGEATEEPADSGDSSSGDDSSGGDDCAAVDAVFISDVTVPDGTQFAPGAAFAKTWRLNNDGCETWPSGTRLVYVSGNQMGGPNSIVAPNNVNPGINTDLTVNLTAPATPGTYRGDWRLQTPDGTQFGPQIYLEIVVVAPTPTPTVTPTATATEEGEIVTVTINPEPHNATGNVSSGGCSSGIRAGIAPAGNGIRGVIAFDVADIVEASQIISAKLDLSQYSLTGNPFEFLHPLIFEQVTGIAHACDYPDSYGNIPERKIVEFADTPGLTANVDITGKFRDAMADEPDTLMIRVRWDGDDAGSAFASMIQWSTVKLTVTYQE